MVGVEGNAFGFEQGALKVIVTVAEGGFGDFTFGIDDPMPRNILFWRDAKQCIADESCSAGQSCEAGDLTIGSDFTVGNPFDGFVNPIVGVHRK